MNWIWRRLSLRAFFFIFLLGNYLFMEASYPRRRGDSCVITSPPLFVYSACLRFYYFMMGIRVGSLVVYARYNNGGRKALWNVTGDKGDQWLQGEVTLSEKQEFKVGSVLHVFCFAAATADRIDSRSPDYFPIIDFSENFQSGHLACHEPVYSPPIPMFRTLE